MKIAVLVIVPVAIVVSLAIFGCGTLQPGTKDWTRHFSRFPGSMERHPGLGGLQLGGVYELKKDMVLTGDSARNALSLDRFGASGAPKSAEDFQKRRKQLERWGNIGIVEAGTRIRGDRVLRHINYFASTSEGIAYKIEAGPHKGKLIFSATSSGFKLRERKPGDPFHIFKDPDPEYWKLIRPPHLDAAGRPLKREENLDGDEPDVDQ